MAKAQATALRKGVERNRDDDNAVKVFELTLRNEVCKRLLLVLGLVEACAWPLETSTEEVIYPLNQVHGTTNRTSFDGVKAP